VLTGIVSGLAFSLLANELRRPVFSPANAWFWLALVFVLAAGFVISTIGLLRRIPFGYFAWSQTVLSFLVTMVYLGWYRRELDYVKMGPDPDALNKGPPEASALGFLMLLLIGLAAALLPAAMMRLGKRILKVIRPEIQ